jgi:hypothetical protein
MKHRLPYLIPYDLSVAGSAAAFTGDAYSYDEAGATGSASGGTVQAGDTIYDESSATGAISGGTTLPADTTYDN